MAPRLLESHEGRSGPAHHVIKLQGCAVHCDQPTLGSPVAGTSRPRSIGCSLLVTAQLSTPLSLSLSLTMHCLTLEVRQYLRWTASDKWLIGCSIIVMHWAGQSIKTNSQLHNQILKTATLLEKALTQCIVGMEMFICATCLCRRTGHCSVTLVQAASIIRRMNCSGLAATCRMK